jgi:uncharacterized membrane protein
MHHFTRHMWFYLALLLGVILWAALRGLEGPLRLALAGDLFFATYLLAAGLRMVGASPDSIRKQAVRDDEGILVIILLTVASVVLSFVAIFGLVNAPGSRHLGLFLLSLAGVPLGWLTLHTVMTWHYAHLFYAPGDGDRKDKGGLEFPGTGEPVMSDFLYYSFVVGMTAQVSDVQVSGRGLRRLTLLHGVISFFFNAVIVALAVNVAIGQAH